MKHQHHHGTHSEGKEQDTIPEEGELKEHLIEKTEHTHEEAMEHDMHGGHTTMGRGTMIITE